MQQAYNTPIQTKYVSLDEFKTFSGIDLEDALGDGASAFVNRTEVRMNTFVNCFGGQNVDVTFPNLSDYQKQEYKYALIEQMIYVLRNGEIGVQSGYDQANLKTENSFILMAKSIAPYARQHLINCGLLSGHLRNYGRSLTFAGWLINGNGL